MKSYIKKAIEKAIDGGYEPVNSSPYKWDYRMQSFFFLDPEFWKCLGKAIGYERSDKGFCSITGKWEKLNPAFYADCLPHREAVMTWGKNWHSFIDHLAEGKDAESFFEELLK